MKKISVCLTLPEFDFIECSRVPGESFASALRRVIDDGMAMGLRTSRPLTPNVPFQIVPSGTKSVTRDIICQADTVIGVWAGGRAARELRRHDEENSQSDS